jgi:hypothetical protein
VRENTVRRATHTPLLCASTFCDGGSSPLTPLERRGKQPAFAAGEPTFFARAQSSPLSPLENTPSLREHIVRRAKQPAFAAEEHTPSLREQPAFAAAEHTFLVLAELAQNSAAEGRR